MIDNMQPDPCWADIFAWLNETIPPSATHTLQNLNNGAAFLLLLTTLSPGTLPTHQIIIAPNSYQETQQNLSILHTTLTKIAPKYELKIGELAQGNRGESLKLLSFLFNTFSKAECKAESASKRSLKPKLANQEQKKVKKKAKIEVTDMDIRQLHQLRQKMTQIEAIVKARKKGEVKLKSICDVLNGSTIVQPAKKYVPKVVTGFTKFLSQEIEYLTNGQKLEKCPQEINGIQMSRQTFSKIDTFKKKNLSMLQENSLYKTLGSFTEDILKYISNNLHLSEQETQVIRNFSKIKGSFECFAYLFTGDNPDAAPLRKYKLQHSSNPKQIRKDMRTFCQRFYCSSLIAKRILLSVILMRSKLSLCRMLSNIELLPSYEFTRQEFFSCQFQCFETEEAETEEQSAFDENKVEQTNIAKKSGNRKGSKKEVTVSTKIKPVTLFWSEHRRVLIAFEARHVYNKKPDFENKQAFEKFINSPAHERMEFDGGFLFPGNRSRMKIDFMKVITQTDKHPHLKALFTQKQPSSNQVRLREFVNIMLDIKHHTIIREFMELYDVIVGEVVHLTMVQKPTCRAEQIKAVAKKAQNAASRINEYFINTYDMPDDTVEVTRLVKVTAYCFLAELHGFNENEYYCDAFEFPSIDLKLSSNKALYEKSTGTKLT